MDAARADPFKSAMADPPDKRKPPPKEEGGSPQKARLNASPERVAEGDDRKRVAVKEWRTALMEAEGLTAAEHHVALTLAYHMHADGAGAYPTVQTLARETHRGERTVKKALKGLRVKRLLHRRRTGRQNYYEAIVPDGADVIELPRSALSDPLEGHSRTDQKGTLGPTEQVQEQVQEQAAAASLTEPNEAEVESRAFELARAEARRQNEIGGHVRSEHGLAKTITHRFRDQARSELINERRRAAVERCSQCDANGFVDVSEDTRARCTHGRTA